MTKKQFTKWLQGKVDEMGDAHEIGHYGVEFDCGDVWREIESHDLLDEIGVPYAMGLAEPRLFFKLEDGLLGSWIETGSEGETIWIIVDWDVELDLHEVSPSSLDDAIGYARANLMNLEALQ